MTKEQPLTQMALKRLKNLAKGNNIDPNKIEVIESTEQTYTIPAKLKLTPNIDVKVKKGIGRPKSKKGKLLPSFKALNQEIESEKKSIQDPSQWLNLALKELDSIKGHGWGHEGTTLFWDKQKTLLTAHENCPTCSGSGHSPCPTCQGLGTVHCIYCDGRKQEYCHLCQGRGKDLTNPKNNCSLCHGTRFIPCRYCRSLGRMTCGQCAGKGNLPCPDCRGTGFHAQQAQLKKCANLSFALSETRKIPSGLLRLMQRVGEDNLYRHAKITMTRSNTEKKKEPTTLLLTAHVPYADVKMRINGKGSMISVFGKNRRITGVPFFLDEAISESRKTLATVAQAKEKLNAALTTRVIQDALTLILQGKQHPNNLRRRYPIGLSANVAKEIMSHMNLSVRNLTRNARLILGSLYTVLANAFFAGIFFTSFFGNFVEGWNPALVYATLITIPFIAIGKCWFLLLYASRRILKSRFKKASIGPTQPVGRVGYIIFATNILLYGAILYFSGVI